MRERRRPYRCRRGSCPRGGRSPARALPSARARRGSCRRAARARRCSRPCRRACSRPRRDRWSARAGCRRPASRAASRPATQTRVHRAARVQALGAAAQDRGVAGLQAQRAGIGGHVRAALVDDADHPERHAHALDASARWAAATRLRRCRRDRAARRSPRGSRRSPRRAPHRAAAGRGARRPDRRRARRPCRARWPRESRRRVPARRAAAAASATFFCAVAASASTAAACTAARPRPSISACEDCASTAAQAPGALLRGRRGDLRPLLRDQHQVVAVDHLVAAAEPEQRRDLGRAPPHDARGVGVGVGDDAARHLGPVRP